MLSPPDLRRVLPGVPRVAVSGPWYRAVAFDDLLGPPPGAPAGSTTQPLWPGTARRGGARFTPKQTSATPSFDSLYVAEDEMTPLLEVTRVLRPPGSGVRLHFRPLVLITVVGALADVVDFTDSGIQSQTGTNLMELTGSWEIAQADYLAGRGPMPPTQMLAQAAYDVGDISALRYPSTKNLAGGIALVIFPGRLIAGQSRLDVFNVPGGRLTRRLP
ncbi:MAG: RES family NAD+ phosphorylase [Acidobacteria bacterium]|nr:RES family NAD+ phosphorylase [Acidobacteriota bacterium]